MSRFKPKVYEAFIQRQKEQQYIVINPNELSIGLESDIEVISKKVCYESQESCQNSEFLQSFQNQIEPDYNSIANNCSGNLEIQPIIISNQFVTNKNNKNTTQSIDINQEHEMNIHQLEIKNLGNICLADYKEKPINSIPQQNDVLKENILFKLLQKRAKPKSQNDFNKSTSNSSQISQTQTRSKSRKIKQGSQIYNDNKEKNRSTSQQEELPTEIKSMGINIFENNKKNPPKFQQSQDKINSKVNQQIEILSKNELNNIQGASKGKIQKTSKGDVFPNTRLKNQQIESKEKHIQQGIIKTRLQASLDNVQKQMDTKNIQIREKQKIKKR
ncbi:unnamed protein product (macronuclear) [Paramecium tetraurelia]|uniref:Uncharacterized protein n=1 Tax=Paramecium tetraurelia TaxID=5888 RepID=A0CVH2_PARTE|nr:uncharacterized protein GSPATT00010957001 [Paramecium tetraurelia]CAK74789.1 unnamed protein product [Paramecium tetraurelia]|eukprot:XP_001442186.1 hypothetical protein (macronuclear) [Paramecium tetraurelia strain d4-2]